jgi:integrase
MAPLIESMPRPRPPHLHREPLKRGEARWYVRVGHGPRTRIRERYGTPEFEEAYLAALRGEGARGARKASGGTLQWLWDRYRDSSKWASLSNATRRQRENIMRHVLARAGQAPLSEIGRREIVAGREQRAKTPSQANNYLDVLRGLFVWGIKAELVRSDPTKGVDNIARPKTEGFRPWTFEEVERFRASWPSGTRERRALEILLFTGLRRGDAAAFGRQHVKNGSFAMRTAKNGIVVEAPVLSKLAEELALAPVDALAYVATKDGRPMTKESFGNWFKDACKKAGVPGNCHGLRKIGATLAAESGASERQLMALFGWEDPAMARLYTKSAEQKRLAAQAANMLAANEAATSIPASRDEVREPAGKR